MTLSAWALQAPADAPMTIGCAAAPTHATTGGLLRDQVYKIKIEINGQLLDPDIFCMM